MRTRSAPRRLLFLVVSVCALGGLAQAGSVPTRTGHIGSSTYSVTSAAGSAPGYVVHVQRQDGTRISRSVTIKPRLFGLLRPYVFKFEVTAPGSKAAKPYNWNWDNTRDWGREHNPMYGRYLRASAR